MDAKEDIKRRLSVEDVIGSYLELKKAGRNFKALSPFTNERTPSFMVSPEKQIWHDFSANKGGDIFTFVMEMEGVDFRGALEILARRAGIDLNLYKSGGDSNAGLKRRMAEALALAERYYQATLAKNQKVVEYLRSRGINRTMIKLFGIGYAPVNGTALSAFLIRRGYNVRELKAAGLISARGNYDMFRGRVTLPLKDITGRTVGFTARIVGQDDHAPKYINTPQTLLYDKGRHVFGLHLAKNEVRRQDSVVLVEGNLDVVASFKAGVKNCVAIAGTALTEEHVKQLSRLSKNFTVAFDGDRAGVAATLRTVPIVQKYDVSLSVVELPKGKDPDDIIRDDKRQWRKLIDSSEYVIDWLMAYYERQYDLRTSQGKKRFSDRMVEVLSAVTDTVEAGHYLKRLAEKLGVSEDSVRAKLERQRQQPRRRKLTKKPRKSNGSDEGGNFTYIDTFLGMLVQYPETREALGKINRAMLQTRDQKRLYGVLVQDQPQKLKSLISTDNYVKIVMFQAEELYGSHDSNERLADAFELARRIAKDNLEMQKNRLTQAIRQAEDAGDIELRDRLLQEYTKL